MEEKELAGHWLRRLDALGRTQARYFWILFIAGLFYLAVETADSDGDSLEVPVVGLRLNRLTIGASGPAVLGFLILTSTGSMRAWGRAKAEFFKIKKNSGSEKLDIAPSALDLATYTTLSSPRIQRFVTWTMYPLFLTLILAEGIGLLILMVWKREAWGWFGFAVAGGVLLVPALILVGMLWATKLKSARNDWKKQKELGVNLLWAGGANETEPEEKPGAV